MRTVRPDRCAFEEAQREERVAIEFGGKMVDPPVVARALELKRRAAHSTPTLA